MPDSWLADYSSCKQLCQDIAELINDRNSEARTGGNVSYLNNLIKKDLLNLKAMTEKLKLDLIKSAKSRSATHGELDRRQNLLDTLTTRGRILNDASDARAGSFDHHQMERAALLAVDSSDEVGTFTNPWLESDEHISSLTADEFRQRQQQVMREQDEGLDKLSDALRRQRNIGLDIGDEAEYQTELIDDIAQRVGHTESRIQQQTQRVGRVMKKSSTCALWTVILLLFVAIVVVIAAVPSRHK